MFKKKLISAVAAVIAVVMLLGTVPAFAMEPPDFFEAESLNELLYWIKNEEYIEDNTWGSWYPLLNPIRAAGSVVTVESTSDEYTLEKISARSDQTSIEYHFGGFTVNIYIPSETTLEEEIAAVNGRFAERYEDLQFESTTAKINGVDTVIYYHDGGECLLKDSNETVNQTPSAIFKVMGCLVQIFVYEDTPDDRWDNAYLDSLTFHEIELFKKIPAYLYCTNDRAEPKSVYIYSVEELEAYIGEYHGGTAPGELDVSKYDEAFFKNNCLCINLVATTGGSPRFQIDWVAQSMSSVSVRITRPDEPTSPDMASWILVLEMDLSSAWRHITIKVENETVTVDPPKWRNPFVDIEEDDWFYEDVKFVYGIGIMRGTDTDVFDPDVSLSRGMIVTMLYRYRGEPSVDGLQNPFDDVPEDTWYTDAVKWAYENGVINGTSPSTYEPEVPVTRQDLATILYRYNKEVEAWELSKHKEYKGFDDEDLIADYAMDAVKEFYEADIIRGKTDAEFAPVDTATRAEAAAMIHRYWDSFMLCAGAL